MAVTLSNLAMERQVVAFAMLETTYGVFSPMAASSALAVLALPDANQQEQFTESAEQRDSASVPGRVLDTTPAGDWSMKLYAHPSGAAGTKPAEAALLKAALGTETISAGVSCVYGCAKELPSLTICTQAGHYSTYMVGALVERLKLSWSAKGYLELEVSGKAKKISRAGTSTTGTGSTTTAIVLASGGAWKFQTGARVKIGSADNSGAGYEVTAVNETTHTLTVSPALASAPGSGETVAGFAPTPAIVGAAQSARMATLTLGSSTMDVRSGSIEVANDIKWFDDVNTADGYTAGGRLRRRTVKASFDCYFEPIHGANFSVARRQYRQALTAVFGTTAGKIMTWAMPLTEINTPAVSTDMVLVQSVTAQAFPSSALEDECTASYT